MLRARRERPRRRTAECGQQFPPSDSDCHTPLPCARCVKATIPRHERAVFTFKEGRMLVASTSVVGFGFRSGKAQFSALPPKADIANLLDMSALCHKRTHALQHMTRIGL